MATAPKPRYAGAALPLPVGALSRAAVSLDAPTEALIAVLTVETGMQGGFLADGRPRILYEAHIAYRLSGRPVPGLSVERWDRSLYATTGAGEYRRLEQAVGLLGEEVALQAASWGIGQILGMNFRLCGYASVLGFVCGMAMGEEQQLGAMLAFLRARGLVPALRQIGGDPACCIPFARGYNGSAYAANAYHEKLAAAWRRQTRGAADDAVLTTGDLGPEVAALQRALTARGQPLVADGAFGRATRIAVEAAQTALGLPATGAVDAATAAALGLSQAP